RLPQSVHNLLFRVTFSWHLPSFGFRPEDHIRAPDSTYRLSHFRVLGQVAIQMNEMWSDSKEAHTRA
ncbi:MAG TPA: hypothetical protein VGK64_01925, partial [Bryobacteraceae bacterium]